MFTARKQHDVCKQAECSLEVLAAVLKTVRLMGWKDVPLVTEPTGNQLVPAEQDWSGATPPDGSAPCGAVPKASGQLALALPTSQAGEADPPSAQGRVAKAPGAPPPSAREPMDRSRSPQATRARTGVPDAVSTQAAGA